MKKILPLIAASALISIPVFANNSDAGDSVTNKLVVYTYDSFASDWGPGPKIKQAFEAQCDCELDFVSLDDGVSVLNRLRLEGKHSKADVLIGLDNNLMAEAKKTGLLAKHSVDTSGVILKDGWSDDMFVPFDYGHFAFIYNKETLSNPPKSLKELVDNKGDIKVIYQDPRTSTPGQGLMLWMKSVYGDDVSNAWKKLAKNTVTVTKGWSEAYSMFLKGEADMVLSYTTSPAYHIIAENKTQYVAADFAEGHYEQIEVAVKVKGTKNEKLADQFMTFILSDEFQSVIATGNWMYPVTNVALPKEFDMLTMPNKSLSFTAEEISENRKTWIREWQNALVN